VYRRHHGLKIAILLERRLQATASRGLSVELDTRLFAASISAPVVVL
jgi:hypothetical protein